MTIKELFNKLQEVNKDLTLELISPQAYVINYDGSAFIGIDLRGDETTFDFEIRGFKEWEIDTIIGALPVVKEFMENYDD